MVNSTQLATKMPQKIVVEHKVSANEARLVDLLEEQTCEIAGTIGAGNSITKEQLDPIVQTVKELVQLWKKQTMVSKKALLLMYGLPKTFESWASMHGKNSATYNNMINFTATVHQNLQEAWEIKK